MKRYLVHYTAYDQGGCLGFGTQLIASYDDLGNEELIQRVEKERPSIHDVCIDQVRRFNGPDEYQNWIMKRRSTRTNP